MPPTCSVSITDRVQPAVALQSPQPCREGRVCWQSGWGDLCSVLSDKLLDILYIAFQQYFDKTKKKGLSHNRRTPRVPVWSLPRDESEIAHKDRSAQYTSSIRSEVASRCADRGEGGTAPTRRDQHVQSA